MTLKPIGCFTLVQFEQANISKGGIHLPDGAGSGIAQAKVVELGTRNANEAGDSIPFDFKVGDTVLVKRTGAHAVPVDGSVATLVPNEHIIAVISA